MMLTSTVSYIIRSGICLRTPYFYSLIYCDTILTIHFVPTALLHYQQKGYDDMKVKWISMKNEVENRKSGIIMKERQMYLNLMKSNKTNHKRDASKKVEDLVACNDGNRLLKAEIAGLLHEMWTNGYDGPLGYFPDAPVSAGKESAIRVSTPQGPPPPSAPQSEVTGATEVRNDLQSCSSFSHSIVLFVKVSEDAAAQTGFRIIKASTSSSEIGCH